MTMHSFERLPKATEKSLPGCRNIATEMITRRRKWSLASHLILLHVFCFLHVLKKDRKCHVEKSILLRSPPWSEGWFDKEEPRIHLAAKTENPEHKGREKGKITVDRTHGSKTSSSSTCSMPGQRLWRWPGIEPVLGQRLAFAAGRTALKLVSCASTSLNSGSFHRFPDVVIPWIIYDFPGREIYFSQLYFRVFFVLLATHLKINRTIREREFRIFICFNPLPAKSFQLYLFVIWRWNCNTNGISSLKWWNIFTFFFKYTFSKLSYLSNWTSTPNNYIIYFQWHGIWPETCLKPCNYIRA